MTHLAVKTIEYKLANEQEKGQVFAKMQEEKLMKLVFFGIEPSLKEFLEESKEFCIVCYIKKQLAAVAWITTIADKHYISLVFFKGYRVYKFNIVKVALETLDSLGYKKLYCWTYRNNFYLKKFIKELGFRFIKKIDKLEAYYYNKGE